MLHALLLLLFINIAVCQLMKVNNYHVHYEV